MPEADDDISRLVRESVDRLATIGAIIEEVSIPMHCDGKVYLAFSIDFQIKFLTSAIIFLGGIGSACEY